MADTRKSFENENTDNTPEALDTQFVDLLSASPTDDVMLSRPKLPDSYPPTARFIEEFNFNKPPLPNSMKATMHIGEKDGEKHWVKENPPNSPMSDSEVFACTVFGYYVPEQAPKDACIVYDYDNDINEYRIRYVDTLDIKNFKTNKEDPLKEEDIVIGIVETGSAYLRLELKKTLTELSQCLNRWETNDTKTKESSWLYTASSYAFMYAKNTYQSLTNANTAVYVKNQIDALLAPDVEFNRDIIFQLIRNIEARQKYILSATYNQTLTDENKRQKNETEQQLLKSVHAQAIHFLKIAIDHKMDVKKLEEMARWVKRHKINLDELNENTILKGRIFEESPAIAADYELLVKDLRNYLTIRGIAKGQTASFLCAEGDYHENNGSKRGERCDFALMDEDFVIRFLDLNWVKTLFETLRGRIPDENSFAVTVKGIEALPFIVDAPGFYFWPTQETIIPQSITNSLAKVLKDFIKDNAYTSEHTSPFKKLAGHPVYDFHKYATALKMVMTPLGIYHPTSILKARDDLTYDPKKTNEKVPLMPDYVDYKIERIKNLRKTLIRSREFREFLHENGDYVYKLIKEEFDALRQQFEKQKTFFQGVENKKGITCCENLINELNPAGIQETFDKIKSFCNLLKENPNLTDEDLERLTIERNNNVKKSSPAKIPLDRNRLFHSTYCEGNKSPTPQVDNVAASEMIRVKNGLS